MSDRFLSASLAALAAGILLQSADAYAESFEGLSYTPPRGWAVQNAQEGKAYVRPTGVGVITFYAGRPDASPAPQAFAALWRTRVEPVLPGPVPEPQIQREGDFTVAVGAQQARAQDTTVTLSLVTVTGRGRTLGVLGMAGADEALRELTAFFDTVKLTPAASVGLAPAPLAPGAASEVEVEFDVPPGYVARREGGDVALSPMSAERTPCAYGISPPRPSRGALDKDAQAALVEVVLPDWQRKGDWTSSVRGNAAAGWPYFRVQSDFQRNVTASFEYVTAMALVFPAERGRVHVVWGVGNPARCTFDDVSFARLFYSLRPRGWASDGGKALLRDLQGTWRNSERDGISQYTFSADGRYERGLATATRLGLEERTSAGVEGGRHELRSGALILTPDRRDRDSSRYRVRVNDEFLVVRGRWTRAMSLLDESESGNEVRYDRVDPQAR